MLTTEWERDPLRGAFPGQEQPAHDPLSHLELVRNADALLIAPATANTIAKLAAGMADNLLTSAALAATCPVIVAPAMNHHMWEHAATVANLRLLRERGVEVVGPASGELAEGEVGVGRMAEPAEIVARAEELLGLTRTLVDVHVLVTAGGTREPIDSIRFIGNRSSGRMGFALAEEAAALGAQVTVVAANVALTRHPRVRYLDVVTAAELADACTQEFPSCDLLLMAAAVADFRPRDPQAGKLKKTGRDGLQIELEPTEDVLSALAAARRPDQTLVGFAAEHGAGALDYGREKLARKGLDAIVVNDVGGEGIGFDAIDNEVVVLTRQDEIHVPRRTKAEVARVILETAGLLRAGRPSPAP